METYRVYRVNKGLGVISGEISDRLGRIMIGENGHYQRDALVRGKGITDQLLPGRMDTINKDTIRLTDR